MRPARVEAAVLAVFAIAGTAVNVFWMMSTESSGWRLWLVIAIAGCATLAAVLTILNPNVGGLIWDGSSWRLESSQGLDGPSGRISEISVQIDLQILVLAHFVASDGTVSQCSGWLWLERRQNPAAWKALRRALVTTGRSADRALPGIRQESGHDRT